MDKQLFKKILGSRFSFIFFSVFLFLMSFIYISNSKKKIAKWLIISSIDEMYGDTNLSQCSLFVGGFINFGFWPDNLPFRQLTNNERLESEKNLYRYVLEKIAVNSEDEVLEVACGLGLGSVLAKNEFLPKRIEGIDGSIAQINRAKAINQNEINQYDGNLFFQQGLAEDIPSKTCNFDKIFSIEAAQHFSNFEKFVKESFRTLKPNGRLAIATFFGVDDESEAIAANFIPTVKDGIDHLMPIHKVREILEKQGFTNIEIESIGKNVWRGFDKWISQGEFAGTWDENWYKIYQDKVVDYYLITAQKPSASNSFSFF